MTVDPYLRKNLAFMEKKSTRGYWLLFFASLALAVGVYLYLPSMVSLTVIPIVTTLVKALDII